MNMKRIPDYGWQDAFYLRKRNLVDFLERRRRNLLDFLKIDRENDPDAEDFEWDITPIPPIIRGDSNQYWFCFLPNYIATDTTFLPKEGNVYCYSPPMRIASPKEGKTRSALERMSRVAIDQISDLNLGPEQVANFYGVSFGTVSEFDVASYLARMGFNIGRAVSVVSGMDLPWCILNSTVTRRTARKARRMDYEYEDLADFSPGTTIEGMASIKSMEFYLGGRDRVVPSENQHELVNKAIKVMGADKVKTTIYPNSGHVQTVKWFSEDWQQ